MSHPSDASQKSAGDDKRRAYEQVKADQDQARRDQDAARSESEPSEAAQDTPAAHVSALGKDASDRKLVASSGRLRDLLLSDRPFGLRNLAWAILAATLVLMLFITATGRVDSVAQDLMRRFNSPPPEPPAETAAPRVTPNGRLGSFAFSDLPLHPDVVHRPYTAGPLLSSASSAPPKLIGPFRELLDLYTQVQGRDSNFDVRVVDNRTGELLELYTLGEMQAAYQENEPDHYNWSRVDQQRRVQTRRLVDKYVARGVPKDAITVKWGRANQVMQARQRDLPFVEYEVRLARYLGLSLLPTEIGTVETFNQDRLVSSVGARSRYQMMPYLLRQQDIHHYSLQAAAGNAIEVAEEWHPLITMESSFTILSGYINAVGHEIPGISAYHTGPGNIFNVYRRFLTKGLDRFTSQTTVMDSYMWAVTEGFDTVREGTSFGPYSRKYVASAYGALKAVEGLTVDTARTMRTERVQLKPGRTVQLGRVLRVLEAAEDSVYWGATLETVPSLYARFRTQNQHMTLPDAEADASVPLRGDVRLTARAGGHPVRFFLPLGATTALKAADIDVIDESATQRFDNDTYPEPTAGTRTVWDLRYDQLVQDISQFGFTNENRKRLLTLADRFDALADETPTPYRMKQQDVIQMHKRVWLSNVWVKLADATAAATGTNRAPVQPPTTPLAPTPLSPTVDQLRQR